MDAAGSLYNTRDREIEVTVAGPAVLQALGSANPCTEERFTDSTQTTFDGRAIAMILPTAPGTVTVTATAAGCAPQVVTFAASDSGAPFPASPT